MCQHVTPQALDEHGMWLLWAYTPLVQKRMAYRVGYAVLPKCLPWHGWSLLTRRLTTPARWTHGNTSPGLIKHRSATERRVDPAPSRMQGRCSLQPPSIIERFPPSNPPDGGSTLLPLNRAPSRLRRGHRERLRP
jgi:hypothetical protein